MNLFYELTAEELEREVISGEIGKLQYLRQMTSLTYKYICEEKKFGVVVGSFIKTSIAIYLASCFAIGFIRAFIIVIKKRFRREA